MEQGTVEGVTVHMTNNLPSTSAYPGWGDFVNLTDGLAAQSVNQQTGNMVRTYLTRTPVDILLRVRNVDTATDWCVVIEFEDYGGNRVTTTISYGDLTDRNFTWFKNLLDLGLEISETAGFVIGLMSDYLLQANNLPTGYWTNRSGWLPDMSGFMIGEGVFPHKSDIVQRAEVPSPFASQGSLADWQAGVAAHCESNPLLLFGLLVALSGPLLGLVNADSTIFHYVSTTTTGKSTALKAAASIWGCPQVDGFLETWKTTVTALEVKCATRRDTFIALDELGQAKPQELDNVSYMVAQGVGKSRGTPDGGLRKNKTWRIQALSSGEVSLHAALNKTSEVQGGMALRFLDIGVPTVVSHFDGFAGPAELADELKERCLTTFGTAGPAFVASLVADREGAITAIKDRRKWFIERNFNAETDASEVRRVCQAFGLVLAAGDLAHDYEVLPFSVERFEKAVQVAFDAWVGHRGGKDRQDVERLVDLLRGFLLEHLATNFVTWDPTRYTKSYEASFRSPRKLYGFAKVSSLRDATILIPKEILEKRVFAGRDLKTCLGLLREAGVLNLPPGGGRLATASAVPPNTSFGTKSFYEFDSEQLNLNDLIWAVHTGAYDAVTEDLFAHHKTHIFFDLFDEYGCMERAIHRDRSVSETELKAMARQWRE